jgi:NADPH:quinone reductase-like Zn-dependent oxidoreductase
VIIGFLGGVRTEFNLPALHAKQGSIHGTTLRARPPRDKATVVAGVRDNVWPLIGSGQIAAVIDRKLPMSRAAEAHRAMAAGEHVGKILLLPG